jgi:hypothetical protein
MRIEYRINNSECITPCPHKEKAAGHVIMVGSWLCNDCKYSMYRSTNDKIVECGFVGNYSLPEELFEI